MSGLTRRGLLRAACGLPVAVAAGVAVRGTTKAPSLETFRKAVEACEAQTARAMAVYDPKQGWVAIWLDVLHSMFWDCRERVGEPQKWVVGPEWWKRMARPATLYGLSVEVDPAVAVGCVCLVPPFGWWHRGYVHGSDEEQSC